MTLIESRTPTPPTATGVAHELAAVVTPLFGGHLPIRIRAWDGSVAGPPEDSGAPTVVVNDSAALRRLVFRPGELGLAQAYVTGEIDVEGDLLDGFRRVWQAVRENGASRGSARPPSSPGSAPPRSWARSASARAAGVAGPAAWPAALPDPRPGRDLAPLRPVQRLLRADPRPAHGVLLRLLHAGPRRPDVHRRGRAARQARPGLPQARPARGGARPPAPRHRLRLGLAVALRRRDVRRAGRRRDDRRGAEGVHRRADRRAGTAGQGRDPAPGLPRRPGRPLRHDLLHRDGGARRAEELPGLHGRHPPPARRRRPRADPADVADHPPRRRAVHRGVHRPRHAHAPGRRDRGPHRAGRTRGPGRARAARALRVDRRRVVPHVRGQLGPRRGAWSARRSPASGGSTSWAARWPSRRAGWASTRS